MATETKVKIDINADFDRLSETVMRVKRERDAAVTLLREIAQIGRLWRVLDEDQWNRMYNKAENLLTEIDS